jgi:hypothetical protein
MLVMSEVKNARRSTGRRGRAAVKGMASGKTALLVCCLSAQNFSFFLSFFFWLMLVDRIVLLFLLCLFIYVNVYIFMNLL